MTVSGAACAGYVDRGAVADLFSGRMSGSVRHVSVDTIIRCVFFTGRRHLTQKTVVLWCSVTLLLGGLHHLVGE